MKTQPTNKKIDHSYTQTWEDKGFVFCEDCNGYHRNKPTNKKIEYKYKCFKCGKSFVVGDELETDKPTCNECFKELLKINNAKDYYSFIGK